MMINNRYIAKILLAVFCLSILQNFYFMSPALAQGPCQEFEDDLRDARES